MNSPSRRTVSPALQGLVIASLFALVFLASSFRFTEEYEVYLGFAPSETVQLTELGAFTLVVPTIRYGLELERFGGLVKSRIPAKASIASLLREAGIDRRTANELASAAAAKIDKLKLEGLMSVVVHDSVAQVAYLIVELNELEFLRIDVAKGIVTIEDADGIHSEFETMAMFFNGSVDSMLAANAFDGQLANQIQQALVKDMPLDPNFKAGLVSLIYTAKRNDAGEVLGYGSVEAVRYSLGKQVHTTFRFADDKLDVDGFFNPDGTPVSRTWLSSPVAEGVISSPYNLRRLHPVLQTVQPHFGTDFAANQGTPVLALTDGIVVARASAGNNGNFVKISHDDKYATQYLHLKGFARGLRPGKRVKKGEVIGFVGSTGLSSGPHVCLRFWKNDQQVDFQRELRRLPTTPALTDEAMVAFARKQAKMHELLSPRA